MCRILYPDEIIPSAYYIDYDRLYAEGYRGVIYDVDNTLVPHGAPADNRAKALFAHLHELGMKAVFVSNNKEDRVAEFAGEVGEEYVFLAHKPGTSGYIKAMKMMGTTVEDTFSVGDQIFTDTWGAKRAGLLTILTRPINSTEEIQIIIKRILEKPVLLNYRIYRKLHKPDNEKSVLLPLDPDGTYPILYGEYNGQAGTMKNKMT
ncbi:MAG: YqeG family HAD IIIA-type phosphatase [Clostridiales bacterium]|nr:YqeG family HAD IIIA-type phosphatase [Clostridiales bacterium]